MGVYFACGRKAGNLQSIGRLCWGLKIHPRIHRHQISVLIRESHPPHRSGQWLIQRLTSSQSAERKLMDDGVPSHTWGIYVTLCHVTGSRLSGRGCRGPAVEVSFGHDKATIL